MRKEVSCHEQTVVEGCGRSRDQNARSDRDRYDRDFLRDRGRKLADRAERFGAGCDPVAADFGGRAA